MTISETDMQIIQKSVKCVQSGIPLPESIRKHLNALGLDLFQDYKGVPVEVAVPVNNRRIKRNG